MTHVIKYVLCFLGLYCGTSSVTVALSGEFISGKFVSNLDENSPWKNKSETK
jgi:hypothetical protein